MSFYKLADVLTGRICLFCGGRGSANLIRALIQEPQVQLSLLVNAYDDGLSTGRIRAFIPGLLGPSDLRKNMSYLIDLSTDAQFAALELLEYRLPSASLEAEKAWLAFKKLNSTSQLTTNFLRLSKHQREAFKRWTDAFEDYRKTSQQAFDFGDCAFGNILLAGAFLLEGRNFNLAVSKLSQTLKLRGEVLNITDGENLFLGARRSSGALCLDEAEMVQIKNPDPIVETFLMKEKPAAAYDPSVSGASALKLQAHQDLSKVYPNANPQALERLSEAQFVIYGAGSQSSSLWPSYITKGVSESIASNRAAKKIMLLNISPDNDIQNLSAFEIIQGSLSHLNAGRPEEVFSHVFIHRAKDSPLSLSDEEVSRLHPIRVVTEDFEHAELSGTHSGYSLLGRLNELLQAEEIRLSIHLDGLAQSKLRPLYERQIADLKKRFSDQSIVVTFGGECEYDLILGGDGQYVLQDLLPAVELIRLHQPDLIVGSRVLKKSQFTESLQSAYRLNPLLKVFAKWGGFIASVLFSMRFGQFLSDPLSELALVRRRDSKSTNTLELLTEVASRNGVILEVPISYRQTALSRTGQKRLWVGLQKIGRILFS